MRKFFCLKKGTIFIKKSGSKLIIENAGNNNGYLLYAKPLFTNKRTIKIYSEIKMINGEDCVIKLLNKKLRTVNNYEINEKHYQTDTNKLMFVGLLVRPKSKLIINSLSIKTVNDDERIQSIIDYFQDNNLLVCPGYPGKTDKYNCAFIHTRVKEYFKINMGINIAHVNDQFSNKVSFSSFENIPVIRMGFFELRQILYYKHFEKILIHFFNERYAQVLDSISTDNTQLYFYLHGAETLYWDWLKITNGYFCDESNLSVELTQLFKIRDNVIKKYNSMPNVHWMFVTPWTKKHSEELIGINYNNANIIPCYVDSAIFNYKDKNIELRKKIFVIRPFKNVSTYAVDIDVNVILELSRRPFFNDLEFDIYGFGEMFDILTYPLKCFKNVHLFNKFLSHDEISQMHKEHGIGLFATRYDSQAISCCEAALSGCVVVSSDNPGIKQEINEKYNTLCNQENYKEYADVIQRLYENPKEFKELSLKMSNDIKKIYSYENTIQKELKIFNQKNTKEGLSIDYDNISPRPLLTVVVPAYNVEKYLDGTLFSLTNIKNSNKIEIIVVNDGSTDDTLKIAEIWRKKTSKGKKSIVKVIDKSNGGHGSVINVAMEIARGKYFRIIDGDDTFDSSEFEKFIELLSVENADLILTDFVDDNAQTNTKDYNDFYYMLKPFVEYYFDDLCYPGYGFDKYGAILSTSTYKTAKLREKSFSVTEKMPYDDMEFNFYAIQTMKTVKYYPLYVYNYFHGRVEQTVSEISLRKNCDKHRIIALKLADLYANIDNTLSIQKKNYLKNKVVLNMIMSQYEINCNYFKSGKKFRVFDKELKKHPELYNEVYKQGSNFPNVSSRKIKFLRKTNGCVLLVYIINKIRRLR